MSARTVGWLRYGVPGVALGVLLSWGAGFHGEPAGARAQDGGLAPGTMRSSPPAAAKASGEANGILALITNPSAVPPIQWLYLIDTKKRAFALYRVDPTNPQGSVKLEASRHFEWDLGLDDYNNQGLVPADVKARLEALNRSNR